MIVAKFGGTAVTPQNLHCIKNILTPAHGCVVVSAIGREHPTDTKVTDLLKSHFQCDAAAWEKIADKYRRLVAVNGVDIDVESLLHSAFYRSRRYDLAYCMSLGEELSAKIVAAFLRRPYLEADRLIVFRNGRLARTETFRRIRDAVSQGFTGVVGGFYGGAILGNSPRQTFSRGGGDVTGAIFAAATHSTIYENWTDVCGVCLADPKSVSGAVTVQNLSYHEMRMLADCGAQVLHPQSVSYVEKYGIPIKIGNYLNPQGASTLVSNCPSGLPLLFATEKVTNDAYRTTVLSNLPTHEVVEVLSALFCKLSVCNNHTVPVGTQSQPPFALYSCNVKANRAQIVTTRSILKDVYHAFSQYM